MTGPEIIHEHMGKIVGGGTAGIGAAFIITFREMIKDAWNDYRARKRVEAQKVDNEIRATQAAGRNTDKMGAEITHALIELLRKDLDDRKEEEGRRWTVVSNMVDQMKSQAQSIMGLNEKAGQINTVLAILASRK